jgi:hypothetical protein
MEADHGGGFYSSQIKHHKNLGLVKYFFKARVNMTLPELTEKTYILTKN